MPNFLAGLQVAAVMLQTQTGPPSTVQVSDELRVEWRVQTYTADSQIARYEQGVKATFGPTVLYCDTLELNFTEKTGVATGHIRLVDPEGELSAASLTFNWLDKTGTATDVQIQIEGLKLAVAKIRITPRRWVLDRADIATTKAVKPDFAISARQLTIEPGRTGVIKDGRFAFFGVRLPAIPLLSFSLDRRVEGLRLPSVSFRRRAGFGLTWSSGFFLGDQVSLSAQTGTFPDVLPYSSVALSWTKLKADRAASFVRPRNELDDPFGYSYLESVRVRSPEQEDNRAGEVRQSLAIMSTWNQEALARLVTAQTISKPAEFVGELGGSRAGFGGYGQLRFQRIRPSARAEDMNRVVMWTTLITPPFAVSNSVALRGRLDLFGTTRGDRRYGWARAAVSAVAQPVSWLRLAAGYSRGLERGRPDYEFDRLAIRESVSVRGDILLGNYRASAITKYSPINRRWYDTEFALSFVTGSFEPFVRTRLFPREFTIGVNLRLTDVFNRLTERSVKRRTDTQQNKKADPQSDLPSSSDLFDR